MGSSKNKSKKKDATKTRKMDNYHNKTDKILKGDCRRSATTLEQNLINLFKSDELQELRKILKVKDLSNMPVLLGAILLCKFDMVKKFIKQGCKVNEIVFENLTALMWCVKMKNLKMIELLISRGADVKVVDSNGDNILFNALNVSTWDENTFMDFYNRIKKTNEIDINYANKTKFTILHFAVKRQWSALVEALIEENVNMNVTSIKGVTPLVFAALKNDKNIVSILIKGGANVLFEDFRGCTSVCYVIGNIYQKHKEPPFEILDELTINFNMTEQYSYESYFKRRLELLINPPNNNTAAYNYVINKLFNPIIKFFKKYLPFGIDIFLISDIFEKLKEGMEKHIKSVDYIQATLSSMGIVLQWCNCCVNIMNRESTEYDLIDKFCGSGAGNLCLRIASVYKDTSYFKQLLPLCLTPIILACSSKNISARTWLKNCLVEVQQCYEKFTAICGIDTLNDPQHEEMMRQRFRQFKEIYDELLFKKETGYLVNEPNVSITVVDNSELVSSGKKTSKRLRRKTRARIAKIRSADMAERCKNNASNISLHLDQSGSFIHEQDNSVKDISKFYSDESLIEKNYSFCVEIIEIKAVNPNSTESAESLETHNDISTSTNTQEDNNILHLQNNLRSINSTTSYGTNDSGVIISDDLLNIDIIDANIKNLLENNSIANKRGEFNAHLLQLKAMFNTIVDKYKHFWNIEAKLNHPGFIGGYGKKVHPLMRGHRDKQIQFLKMYMSHLEQKQISHLVENFLKTIDRIEELFYMNDDSYMMLMERLKHCLSMHKIRNEKVFTNDDCRENNEEYEPEIYQNNEENLHEQVPRNRPTYLQLIENIVPKKGEISDRTYILNGLHDLAENDIQVFKASEMQMHFSEDYSFNKPYKKRKLQERDEITLEFNAEESEKIYRWGTLIENLKEHFKRNIHKDIPTECSVITCPPEIRPRYIIATGGNFGALELALTKNNTPLALKRIPYENSNGSRMIRSCVEQLLQLKHANILRYVSCEQDEKGDLCVTTPLCEFNLGEYLMLLKMENERYKHYYSIVNINYLVAQLLHGLEYLHEQDPPVIHGNLKPSNVLIGSKGQLRLAEFGIHGILYQNETAPKSSQIWFARETYENYDRFSTMDCTKYSDIQVAGMLVHFALSKGLHPFGIIANDILFNLVKGFPILRTSNNEVNDLLSWMLAHKVSNRPSIKEVLTHMCFWSQTKKWHFVLLCTGIRRKGTPLEDNEKEELYSSLDSLSEHYNVAGDWVCVLRKRYPGVEIPIPEDICQHSLPGLLAFIRSCAELKQSAIDDELIRKFFAFAFPTLPLSLFRLVDNSCWRHSPLFIDFFQSF